MTCPVCPVQQEAIHTLAAENRDLHEAVVQRNDLARKVADLTDERDALASKVTLLEPLATAGREYVAVWEAKRAGEVDDEDLTFALATLRDAAEAWWDR